MTSYSTLQYSAASFTPMLCPATSTVATPNEITSLFCPITPTRYVYDKFDDYFANDPPLLLCFSLCSDRVVGAALFVGLGLGFWQQASGSEAAVYYSPHVLEVRETERRGWGWGWEKTGERKERGRFVSVSSQWYRRSGGGGKETAGGRGRHVVVLHAPGDRCVSIRSKPKPCASSSG